MTTFRGLAEAVEREVVALGFAPQKRHATGVELAGTLRDCLRLCLHLRTALNVQWLLDEFPCAGAEELFRRARSLPWEELVPADGYLHVDSRVEHESIKNTMFPNLKLKDAIVDRVSERRGSRPDSGPDERGTIVNLYWKQDRAWLYLSASGRKLADRGYRRLPHSAPLRENLAAALVLESGYDGSVPFVAPMCGSGTLAIEAALIGQGRAPGLLRDEFGFKHILGFDLREYEDTRRAARAVAKREVAPIVATDIDPAAVRAAQKNAQTAGVDRLIEFRTCDFAATPLPPGPGIIMLNPEYGQRLGEVKELEATYARLGDYFKQRCAGYTGFVFTGNLELAKKIGLRARRRVPFWNAKLECRLLEYELYAGSRTPKAESSPEVAGEKNGGDANAAPK